MDKSVRWIPLCILAVVIGAASGCQNTQGKQSATAVETTAAQKPKAPPVGTKVPNNSPPPGEPKNTVPILLGKTREQVLRILGTPDETESREAGSTAGSAATLVWHYKDKPLPNSSISVDFSVGSFSNGWYRGDHTVRLKDLRTVQYVLFKNSYRPYGGKVVNNVRPRDIVPASILSVKPKGYLASKVRSGDTYHLELIWQVAGNTYLVGVEGEKFYAEDKKIDPVSGALDYTYRLSSSAHNWQECPIVYFRQLRGALAFRDIGPYFPFGQPFIELK